MMSSIITGLFSSQGQSAQTSRSQGEEHRKEEDRVTQGLTARVSEDTVLPERIQCLTA